VAERTGCRRLPAGAVNVAAMIAVTVAVLAAPTAELSAQSAGQRGDTVGTITGVVVARESGVGLGYSIVSVPSRGVEKLSNERGEFTLRELRPGVIELVVRHLGYSPVRVSRTVRVGTVDTVRVELTKLATQLGAVQVRAARVCTNPGPPKAGVDPAFAAVFEQLEQNADQYRLVSATYPFVYDMERRSSIRYVSGEVVTQRIDTVRINTGVAWKYAPGSVVDRTEDPHNRQVLFNIPSLIHFADPVFLANHCFFLAGRDTADGAPAIRIDFLAASKLKAPDVDGSMYIDPDTYQIRRSVLRLTKIPPETPEISSVTTTTEFRTVVPWISIVSSISSVHRLSTDMTRPVLPYAAYENQRLLGVVFLKEKPGGR
jgi:Carboxypeptidase regulatory-like domain